VSDDAIEQAEPGRPSRKNSNSQNLLALTEFLLQKLGWHVISTWRRVVGDNYRPFPLAPVLSPLQFVEIAIKRTAEVHFLSQREIQMAPTGRRGAPETTGRSFTSRSGPEKIRR
jgi:hypothetical protein